MLFLKRLGNIKAITVEPSFARIVVWVSPTTVFGFGQDYGELQVNEHRLRDIAKEGA